MSLILAFLLAWACFAIWWQRDEQLFWKRMYENQEEHNRHLFRRVMGWDEEGEEWKRDS